MSSSGEENKSDGQEQPPTSTVPVDILPSSPTENESLNFKPFELLYQLFENYKTALRLAPLTTKSITSCTISILGEIFGCYIRCKAKGEKFWIDAKRVGIFGLYGLVITGPVLHWWYGLLEKSLNDLNFQGYAKTLAKLIIDRCIFGPPFVLLTIIFIQGLQTLSGPKTIEYIRRSYTSVLILNEKIWTIAQAINFELIPVEYQVLFVNAVSIGWNTALSLAV